MMGDIRLQLARYAQGIHWVQKNFLLDESIKAVLVTAGHMDLLAAPQKPGAGSPDSSQAPHVVLQMQPQFDVPFPAPESWNQQVPSSHLLSAFQDNTITLAGSHLYLQVPLYSFEICSNSLPVCMHWPRSRQVLIAAAS